MTRKPLFLMAGAAPIIASAGLGLMAAQGPAPLLVNESPSLPEGLYRLAPGAAPDRGAIVAFRQPASVRAYLARRGMPSEVRLIKRVAATGGDLVCSDGRWLIAPFRSEPVRDRDRAGNRLPVWTGCRRLAPDERFLLGDTPTSLDSRTFGPVVTARIEGVYRETLTW